MIIKKLNSKLIKVLENEVCSAQALDVVADRNRVRKEVMKMLEVELNFCAKGGHGFCMGQICSCECH